MISLTIALPETGFFFDDSPKKFDFWPFRVIFFQKVERLCGQTVKDRFDFSIDLGQLCLVHPRNTFVWPQKKIWSRVQHPYFSPVEPFLGKD